MAPDDPDRAGLDRVEEAAEPRQVEVLVEALAKGLDDDGEVGELAGDLEQVLGAEPLEPERGALRRVGPGHEHGPGGVLAEPQAEERGLGQLLADQPLRQLARQAVEEVERGLVLVGQAEEEAGVDVQAGGGQAEPPADPGQQGELQAPGGACRRTA